MCGISALEEEAEALDDRKRVLEGSILELKHELRLVMASRERVRSKLDDLTALQAREVIQSDDRFACELDAVARKYFGVVSFRENQKEACTAILNGFDVSLVMPTGGGKTLCVVLPTIILGKLTVVVSPLVSLMVDQVSMLKAHGLAAEYLSGQCSRQRQTSVRQQLKAAVGNPELQLLFVTPERVAKSKLLLSVLEKIHDAGHLGLLAVDEAHCVSKWGHSFRPDYARLTLLKKHFRCPILAMTATATPAVLKDLQTVLGIQKSLVFKSHVVRHNLHYRVVWRPKTLQGSVEWLATFIKGRPGHSGVVYCITRKDSETVADLLNSSGVASGYYHGDLDGMFFHCVYFLIFHVPTSITASSRNSIYEQWSDHRLQVVVATTAFGMGIHKGDVRFVIHMGLPKSISNFYQESGRAGRDGLPADCVVMYRPGDVSRHSCMVYWEKSGLDELYQCARFCTTDKCRRVLVSKYFGDPEPTCSVCDNCRNPREPQECLLTTEDLESLEALLKRDAEQDTRSTTLQLATNWKRTLKPKKWLADGIALNLENLQVLLVNMVVTGRIHEEFYHTPYATHSYLRLGSGVGIFPSLLEGCMLGIDLGGPLDRVECPETTSEKILALKRWCQRVAGCAGVFGHNVLDTAELTMVADHLQQLPLKGALTQVWPAAKFDVFSRFVEQFPIEWPQ